MKEQMSYPSSGAEKLTSRSFPPKLGIEGEIFMAEPGNGEILEKGVRPGKRTLSTDIVPQGPQVGSPEYKARFDEILRKISGEMESGEKLKKEMLRKMLRESESKDKSKKEKKKKVSPEEARKAWMEHYKGQNLIGDERRTVEMLINLGITPEIERSPLEQAADYLLKPDTKERFQRQTEELGKLEPEHELVAQRRREAGEEGMPERARVRGQIDTTDITDPALLEQAQLINNMAIRQPGEPDRFNTDFLTRRLEHVTDLPIPDDPNLRDQLARTKQRITDLIMGQRDLENQIRAEQSSQRRYRGYWTEEEEGYIDDESKNSERERIFEEIFVGADSSPGTEWNEAFSLDARSRWDDFISRVGKVPILGENLTREFSARFEARKILHNANWGASGGGNIQVFATAAGTYKDEYTDLIFQDPLVESALHFFEQGFQKIRADNNGQLPYEKLEWNFNRKKLNPETGRLEDNPGSDLEDMVREAMDNARRHGILKERNGSTIHTLEPWRLQRAIVLARGFGVLSLRFPEIAAEARLPEQTALSDANVSAHRTASIYGEAVGKFLDPIEHLIEKFGIGLEDRAILYFFLTGDKGRFASKAQLEIALKMKSQFKPGDQRVIDQINFFRTGGPFSHSSWRQRVSFERLEGETQEDFEKRLKRSGIGVLEARVEGDVDDQIKRDVRTSPEFVGKTDREIESSEKLSADFDKAVKARSDEVKKHLLLEKRLDMWKNALRNNPLRVMWEWEKRETEDNKNPGQRVRFLAEALGVNQDEAKGLLDGVEKDLMIIQEDVVSSRKLIPQDPNEEMLDFNLIGNEAQRERVRLYVEKIREKAREGNYRFFKDVLLKYTSITGDPGIDTPFPFVVGFDDIPFGEFDFIKSGGRGMSRKINDFASAANASTELINLLNGIGTAQSTDPLIEHLVKIKDALSNVDADLAQKLIEPLAEGVIRMYKKDPLAKLPLGAGTFIGMTGDTSFAQKHKGMGAMTWDETDLYNFTKHLTQNSLVSMEKIEKLRWRIGGTVFHAGLDFTRTYLQLLFLIMAIEFAARTVKGK